MTETTARDGSDARKVGKCLDADLLRTLFDKVYVINLPERTDRKREISDQLESIGLSLGDPLVCLFPAIRPEDKGPFPSIGARGCFASHLEILGSAVAEGYRSILILEDDMDWTRLALDPEGDISSALTGTPWEFLHGGPGHDGSRDIRDLRLRRLNPDEGARLTHFIGLRGGAIPTAHRYLSAILGRPAGSPDGGPMHVDGAYSWLRKDHDEIASYVCVPSIARQRPSVSDITPHTGWRALPVIRHALARGRQIRVKLGRRA